MLNNFKKIILVAVFLRSVYSLNAQQILEEEFEYKNEFTYGINFNTAASVIGGLTLKYSFRKSQSQFHSILLEVVNVKHPKEIRIQAAKANNSYFYAKENNLIPMRLFYGRDFILFQKAKQEGVQFNLSIGAGPILGIEKPYLVLYGTSEDSAEYVQNVISTNTPGGEVYGQGNIFMGLDKSKIVPGFGARISGNFEFGVFRANITGIEIGLQGDLYARDIKLIPFAGDKPYFISAFIVGYFGNRW